MKSLLLGSLLGVALLVSGVSYAACNPVLTKPTGIYLVHGDGTVTDNETGLMWEVAPSALAVAWNAALAHSVSSTTASYTDWRLPNSKELASLVDKSCSAPAINTVIYPLVVGSYWTSTPVNNIGSENSAFAINFTNGSLNVTAKNGAANVLLVRAGY